MSAKIHFLPVALKLTTPEQDKAQAIHTGYVGNGGQIEHLVTNCARELQTDTLAGFQRVINRLDGMVKGAWLAFKEDRPDNMQTIILLNAREHIPNDHLLHSSLTVMGNDRTLVAPDLYKVTAKLNNIDRARFFHEAMAHGVSAGKYALTTLLLDAGAPSDGGDQYFMRIAAARHDRKMLNILSDRGGDVDLALRHARAANDNRAAQYLESYKKKPPVMDRRPV